LTTATIPWVTGFTRIAPPSMKVPTLSVTDSQAAEIIQFLEERSLLCKECGEEATFYSDWLRHGCCEAHLRVGHGSNYHERKTTNKLYRRLLSSLGEWARQGVPETSGGGGGDHPASPGVHADPPQLHPSDLGKELSTNLEEVARRLQGFDFSGGLLRRDPLGADIDCYK
jgi:hypothetical protein